MKKRKERKKEEKKLLSKMNVVVAIIIILIIVFLIYTFTKPKFINCKVDKDCRVALTRTENEPCCWDCGYEAINETEFDLRQLYFKQNCENVEVLDCPRCTEYRKSELEAYCNEGLCALRSK